MKLYVGNLPFSVDEEKLRELFSGYGADEVVIIKDKFSGRSKGFGFVTIPDDESAKKAISAMNESEVEGRKIVVSEARPMEERPERPRRSFGSRDGGRDFGGRSSFGGGRGRRF